MNKMATHSINNMVICKYPIQNEDSQTRRNKSSVLFKILHGDLFSNIDQRVEGSRHILSKISNEDTKVDVNILSGHEKNLKSLHQKFYQSHTSDTLERKELVSIVKQCNVLGNKVENMGEKYNCRQGLEKGSVSGEKSVQECYHVQKLLSPLLQECKSLTKSAQEHVIHDDKEILNEALSLELPYTPNIDRLKHNWLNYLHADTTNHSVAKEHYQRDRAKKEHGLTSWICMLTKNKIYDLQSHAGAKSQYYNCLHNFVDVEDTNNVDETRNYRPGRLHPEHSTKKLSHAHNQNQHETEDEIVTPDMKSTQLKLLTMAAHVILMFVNNEFEHNRHELNKQGKQWTWQDQLKNTVVLYIGSHNHSNNMFRSHIIGLLEMFPYIRMVCLDLDSNTLKMTEVLREAGIDANRFAVIRTKMTIDKAIKVQKFLRKDGHRMCVISDIRSDIDIECVNVHKTFLSKLVCAVQKAPTSKDIVQQISDHFKRLLYFMARIENSILWDNHFQWKCILNMKNVTFSSWKIRLLYGDDEIRLLMNEDWLKIQSEQGKIPERMCLTLSSAYGRYNSSELRGLVGVDYDSIRQHADTMKDSSWQTKPKSKTHRKQELPSTDHDSDEFWMMQMSKPSPKWTGADFKMLVHQLRPSSQEFRVRTEYRTGEQNPNSNFFERKQIVSQLQDMYFVKNFPIQQKDTEHDDFFKHTYIKEFPTGESLKEIDDKLSRFNQGKRDATYNAVLDMHTAMITNLREEKCNVSNIKDFHKTTTYKLAALGELERESQLECLASKESSSTQTGNPRKKLSKKKKEILKRKLEIRERQMKLHRKIHIGGWNEDEHPADNLIFQLAKHMVENQSEGDAIWDQLHTSLLWCGNNCTVDISSCDEQGSELYLGRTLFVPSDIDLMNEITSSVKYTYGAKENDELRRQNIQKCMVNVLWTTFKRMTFELTSFSSWFTPKNHDGRSVKHAMLHHEFMLGTVITFTWLIGEWSRCNPPTDDVEAAEKSLTELAQQISEQLLSKSTKFFKTVQKKYDPRFDIMLTVGMANWNMLTCSMLCRVLSVMLHPYYLKMTFPFQQHIEHFQEKGPEAYSSTKHYDNYVIVVNSLKFLWNNNCIPQFMDQAVKPKLSQIKDLEEENKFNMIEYIETTKFQEPFSKSLFMQIPKEEAQKLAMSVEFVNDFYNNQLHDISPTESIDDFFEKYGYLFHEAEGSKYIFLARGENNKELTVFNYPPKKPCIWILVRNGVNYVVNGFLDELFKPPRNELQSCEHLMYEDPENISILHQAMWWGRSDLLRELLSRCPYWNTVARSVTWSAQFESKTWTLLQDVTYRIEWIKKRMNQNFDGENMEDFVAAIIHEKQKETKEQETWEQAPKPQSNTLINLQLKNFLECEKILKEDMEKRGMELYSYFVEELKRVRMGKTHQDGLLATLSPEELISPEGGVSDQKKQSFLRYKFGNSDKHVIPATWKPIQELWSDDYEGLTFMTDGRSASVLCDLIIREWNLKFKSKNYKEPTKTDDQRPIIVDACTGLGGNAGPFIVSNYFKKVVCVERKETRYNWMKSFLKKVEECSMPFETIMNQIIDENDRKVEGLKRYEVHNEDFLSWIDKDAQMFPEIVFIDPPWQLNSKDDYYASDKSRKLHLYKGKEEKESTTPYDTTYKDVDGKYHMNQTITTCFGHLRAKMVVIKVPNNFTMDDKKIYETYDFKKLQHSSFLNMTFYMFTQKEKQEKYKPPARR